VIAYDCNNMIVNLSHNIQLERSSRCQLSIHIHKLAVLEKFPSSTTELISDPIPESIEI